jgi:hypothetical protein
MRGSIAVNAVVMTLMRNVMRQIFKVGVTDAQINLKLEQQCDQYYQFSSS